MNPLAARNDYWDDDPTILTPEEEAEDLRDIREARIDAKENGTVSLEALKAELGL
ncbi:MAG: hypothetical protein ABIH23_18125 [bacterium]